MSNRIGRSKSHGQSIPLIALLIVILIGAAGLAVDVGNDYAQQRNTVRATNAAALAGMGALIRGSDDSTIKQVIQQSFKSNKIQGDYNPAAGASADQYSIRAIYLDSKAKPLCEVPCGNVPAGVTYLQVESKGFVNTYFARVLDRQTLPVGATAYAARCAPVDGVYPIAVQDSTIVNGKFAPPSDPSQRVEPYYNGSYRDPNWPVPLTKRRIFLRDNADLPGNFSFLRWSGASSGGSATDLAPMLKIPGNLSSGFDEVTPWPDAGTTEPSGYPIKPGQINIDDWIHGNSGRSNSSAVRDALDEHVRLHDIMILPLVKPALDPDGPSGGNNSFFRIAGLGAFYLNAYDLTGSNPYMDFVYVGTANSTPCLNTPAVTSNTLGIDGSVSLWPRWAQQQNNQPIAFQIIMDTSGSMSWNFAGQGNKNGNGSVLQCEAVGNTPAADCQGSTDYWNVKEERRIYQLKEALRKTGGFIDQMKDGDVMRILSFSDDTGIDPGPGWTGDKAVLKATVLAAGRYRNNDYLTNGGTPGPQAINKAIQQFASTPPPSSYNGQSYRNVVIYMTDGVANVFIDGTRNTAQDVCRGMTDQQAYSTALCQYDKEGYPAALRGMRRPISEMIYQAGILKSTYPTMRLFVLAMANVNPLGLDMVATDPKDLILAKNASDIYTALDDIRGRIAGPCMPRDLGQWVSTIDPAHTAGQPPLPGGVYGYVYLYDSNYQPVSVPWAGAGSDPRAGQTNAIPITQDGIDGKLGYEIPAANGLNAGTYYLKGYLWYKAALPQGDGIARMYNTPQLDGLPTTYVPFVLQPEEILGTTYSVPPLLLDLDRNTVKLCGT